MTYYLAHTSYLILFVAVFARQLCIPVPALLFLLSAGALAGTGKLDYAGVLTLATFGSVFADLVWFEAGRRRGKPVLRLLCSLASDPSYCIRRARTAFESKGLRLLLIAKFVPGLDGICPPLAGMTGASRTKFIAFDSAGSALWAGVYITCGFFFARKLDGIAHYTSVAANALVLILGIPLVLLVGWKLILLLRMLRVLRSTQITAKELKEQLDAGGKVGILDLQRYEDDSQSATAIPGAVRLDPQQVRLKKKIVVPADVSLVLYCQSRNNFVSARVAMMMRKHGIRRVQVLTGGMDAWRLEGLPLSSQLAEPESEFTRLGIEVTPAWNGHDRVTRVDVESHYLNDPKDSRR